MVKWLLKAGTVALGSLLGSACGRAVPEYGAPEASPLVRYKVDGNVVYSVTATPIENILVSLGSRGLVWATNDLSAVSNQQGQWQLDLTTFECGDSCQLIARDAGVAPGGPYADKVVDIGPAKIADATYEQHGIQILLDKK